MAEPQSTPESVPSPSDEQVSSTQPVDTETPNRSLVIRNQAQNPGFLYKFRYPLFAAGFAFLLSPFAFLWPGQSQVEPTNYAERTRRVLKTTPYVPTYHFCNWKSLLTGILV